MYLYMYRYKRNFKKPNFKKPNFKKTSFERSNVKLKLLRRFFKPVKIRMAGLKVKVQRRGYKVNFHGKKYSMISFPTILTVLTLIF